jgi:hypothetical protein
LHHQLLHVHSTADSAELLMEEPTAERFRPALVLIGAFFDLFGNDVLGIRVQDGFQTQKESAHG